MLTAPSGDAALQRIAASSDEPMRRRLAAATDATASSAGTSALQEHLQEPAECYLARISSALHA